jgi:hypothetical protein
MTTPDPDLTTDEGLNEGSADATGDTGETTEGAGEAGALAAASRDAEPAGEYDPAPPLDMLTSDTQPAGPGQQLEAGEG